jgi:hypothetical protein
MRVRSSPQLAEIDAGYALINILCDGLDGRGGHDLRRELFGFGTQLRVLFEQMIKNGGAFLRAQPLKHSGSIAFD